MAIRWGTTRGRKGEDKKTEKEKTQAEAGQEELLWLRRMLSHNVRMPMSVITGYGELLRKGLVTDEEKETIIKEICENITYMDQILSVVFEEEQELVLQRVDVAEVACRMEGYLSEIARKSGVTIRTRAEKPLWILADPVPIMRIFYQLYENAFKYIKQGDTIQVMLYPAEEQALIVFKDNGQGMEEAEAARIFEREFRGSNSTDKRGNGLGMYDVKKLVEEYGGSIRVSSQKGKGLSVFIVFPLAKEGSV